MKPSGKKLEEFHRAIRPEFSGEIHFDRFTRLLYSTDASIYQIVPLAVLLPRNHDDAAAAVSLAGRYRLPVLPRGGGTSLAGQAVGEAVVIDFSKYMNGILEVDPHERWARLEPGVILDSLNLHLRENGLRFGPDVSTGNRATLGGMIGNNSSGSNSIVYGKTIDHVRSLRAVLSDGLECRFAARNADEWRRLVSGTGPESRLYRTLDRVMRENSEEIPARYPKVMRHVGGYSLDYFLKEGAKNLSWIVAGSEGTLAVLTEAVVDLVPAPPCKALGIIHFEDLFAALDAVPEVLELHPTAVELIDRMLLEMTRRQPAFARKMTFVEGDPGGILIVEIDGENEAEVERRLSELEGRLVSRGTGAAFVRAVSAGEQANVWAIRKAGLGLLSSMRGDTRPTAFVEDTAVSPERLGDYVRRFRSILERHGVEAGYYGHASVGCLHIRPLINLKEASGVEKMRDISREVKDLVREFEGAMSAEHGDGIARGQYIRELFGDRLTSAFREIKAAFDPYGICNPGKIIDAPPMTRHLRYGAGYAAARIPTRLDFSAEGGMAGAAEQCNGMGVCRKIDAGTMCPSFMATRDEEHSTRGRANALRSVLSGAFPLEELTGPEMTRAFDLCLACKACKSECPAGVDMAKLKYEFLAQRHAAHGTPLRAQLFGNIARLNRIGAAAPFSNRLLRSSLGRRAARRLLGIHPARKLPELARITFRRWLRSHPPREEGTEEVVLFNDTFMNYNEPAVGIAALAVLEASGARVRVPDVVCCGRPMISQGLLDDARENARRNVALLSPYVESGAWIVGCEPSCILTLREEYPDMLKTDEARRLAGRVLLLEEYLLRRIDDGGWPPEAAGRGESILLHGHCHQKSLAGTEPLVRVLRAAGFEVEEVDSGCCGMAGSFGYEQEHYEISRQIGELRLFPAIRKSPPGTVIAAAGTSCRQQIFDGTGRRAKHPAEILAGCFGARSRVPGS